MLQATISKGRVKRILKSDNSAKHMPFDLAEETTQEYSKIMSKLMKFKKVSKEITKSNQRKLHWASEQSSLQKSASKIDEELQRYLESLLMGAICDEGSSSQVHEIVNEVTASQHERTASRRVLDDQLLELKSIFCQVAAAEPKARTQPSSSGSDEKATAYHLASSIFADLLVQSFASYSDRWSELAQEEKTLSAESRVAVNYISNMLLTDQLNEQDRKLRSDLLLSDDEDPELELFFEEWLKKLRALDKSHQDTLSMLSMEHNQRCEQLGVDVSSKSGGWPDEEHGIFIKIYKMCQEVGSRKFLREELSRSLAGTNLCDPSVLDQHEAWYRSFRAMAAKKKDAHGGYLSNREKLIQTAIEAIAEARDVIKEQREKEAEIKEHEVYRERLHQVLVEQRRCKEQADAQAALRLAKEAEAQKAQQDADTLQALEEATIRHELVMRYQEERREEQRRREEEADKLSREYQMAMREEIERNRENVERREAILIEKLEDKKRRHLEYEVQEQKRLQLLEKLAQQVPYWENIQAATSKLEHITAAAKGHEYIKGEELTRGYIPMNGFTDRQVFKDARFRIAVALRAAGVHQSEAARTLVATLHSRPAAPI